MSTLFAARTKGVLKAKSLINRIGHVYALFCDLDITNKNF